MRSSRKQKNVNFVNLVDGSSQHALQIVIDQTPEGLRIQLVDQEGRSMFENGSSRPNPRAQLLLRAIDGSGARFRSEGSGMRTRANLGVSSSPKGDRPHFR